MRHPAVGGVNSMSDQCELKAANGVHGERCNGEDCPYWRALSHLGTPIGSGCAIEHYELLGDEETVKERLEAAANATSSDAPKSIAR